MTSPHGNGGREQRSELAVYDLRPTEPQPTLPLALGQLLLAMGAVLVTSGLWAFASTTIESSRDAPSDPLVEASDLDSDSGAVESSEDEQEVGEAPEADQKGDEGSQADEQPSTVERPEATEARADFNRSRTVCRFTAPNGTETYICVEPCELPLSARGDGTPVIILGAGQSISRAQFAVGPDGALELLPAGHDETGFIEFVDDGNGGIELQLVGDASDMPLQRGDLEDEVADPEAAPETETDSSEPNTGPANPTGQAVGVTNDGAGDESGSLLIVLAPLLVLLGIGLVGIAGVIIRQAKRNHTTLEIPDETLDPDAEEEPAAVFDDVSPAKQAAEVRVRKITDLIQELRQEPDPALAIQRAYAALETGFGNPALARRPSETCSTYLHRTIGVVGGVSEPLRRLTMLFEVARFSDVAIDEQMRNEAIEALSTVRDAWRARSGSFSLRTDQAAPSA